MIQVQTQALRRGLSTHVLKSHPARSTFTLSRYFSNTVAPKVTPVEKLDEFRQIIKKDKFTVFDFWATWCGPCRAISPVFEELSTSVEHADVEFYNVDVDAASDIAAEVGIRAMPTFMLFKNGQKIDALVGASPEGLKALIKKAA